MRSPNVTLFTLVFGALVAACASSHEGASSKDGGADDAGYDAGADGGGDGDSDGDTDTDTDFDAGFDAGPEGEERCCGTFERPWCPGAPKKGGRACDSVAVMGRSNFTPDNYDSYQINLNNSGLGNDIALECKGAVGKGPDSWHGLFMFQGEKLRIMSSITTWSGGGTGLVFVLKAPGDDFCGTPTVVDCRKLAMTAQPDLEFVADQTGWYAIVYDSTLSGSYYIGSFTAMFYECDVSKDCSCWWDFDDPWVPPDGGPDGGPDADPDAA